MSGIVVGIIFFVISGILLAIWAFQRSKLKKMAAIETSTAQELKNRAQSKPAGGFTEVVELKGAIECDSPLTSELAKEECVYYAMEVIRKYDETYYETDSKTNERVEKTREGTETVASNKRSTRFWVNDGTGRVLVDPEGADMDAEKAVEKFEFDDEDEPDAAVSIGGLKVGFSFNININDNKRTIGFTYRESVLPVGHDVYILGEAANDSGEVMIRKSGNWKDNYIISHRSEEELARSASSQSKWLFVGAMACDVIGAVLLVLTFMKKI